MSRFFFTVESNKSLCRKSGMINKKTIAISKSTRSLLASVASKNESYDEIIKKLIKKWYEKQTIYRYRCKDKRIKRRRLVFDGGTAGQYSVDLCDICYLKQDKKF